MDTLEYLFCLLFVFCLSCGKSDNDISTGCYLDSVSKPDFYVNPDTESTQQGITSGICTEGCRNIDSTIQYAGIQFQNVCLCAYKLTYKDKMKKQPKCTVNDIIGQEEVETEIYLIKKMHYESMSLGCTERKNPEKNEVLSTIECDVSPENPNLQYTFNFGEGGWSSALSEVVEAKNEYFIPGNYKVSAAVVYPNGSYEVLYTTLEVKMKLQTESKFAVECPKLVAPDDLMICNITAFYGTNMDLTISSSGEDCPKNEIKFSLPDITKVSVGLAFPVAKPINVGSQALISDAAAYYYVLASTFVATEGFISTVKVFFFASGKIWLKVLRPKFSTQYCPKAVSCKGSIEEYKVVSSSSPAEVEISGKDGESVTYRISNGLFVKTGDVLGFQLVGSGSPLTSPIGYRDIIDGDLSDFTLTKSGRYGKKLNVQHFVQAIITPKSELVYGHTFPQEGLCTLTFVVQSKSPAGDVKEISKSEGILIGTMDEDFELECDESASVGEYIFFKVEASEPKKFKNIIWKPGGELNDVVQAITNKSATIFTHKFKYLRPGIFSVFVTMESLSKNVTHDCMLQVWLTFIEPEWSLTSNSPQVAPNNITLVLKYLGKENIQSFGLINTTWLWGDESVPVSFRLDKNPFLLTHHYDNQGEYNVSVRLSNQASTLKLKQKVAMLDEMILKVTATYYLVTESRYEPGSGSDSNMFRKDSKIKFTLLCMGATPTDIKSYVIQWANGSKTDINSKEAWPAEHYEDFNTVGNYTITFVATPKVGPASSSTVDLIIMDTDWNFNIFLRDYFIDTNVREPRKLMLHSTVPSSCVIVDFADNSTLEMYGVKSICEKLQSENPMFSNAIWIQTSSASFPMNVSHTYDEINNYNVSLYGFTEKASRITSEMIFINFYPFRPKPEVWILVNSTQFLSPITIKRSDDRQIETGATIAYNDSFSLDVRFDWTIWAVDEDDGVMDLKDKNWLEGYDEPTNKSYLYLKAKLLPYGLYKVVYNYSVVKGGKDLGCPLSVNAYTYLRVISSDLVPVIINNAVRYIERSYGQMIYLNPMELSVDPDGEAGNFSVVWICRETSERFDNFNDNKIQEVPEPGVENSASGGGCFGSGPGVVNVNEGLWEFNTSSLISKKMKISILIRVAKGARSAVAILDVKVVPHIIPVLDLRCAVPKLCLKIGNVRNLLNPELRLAMIGECTEDCPPNLQYKWIFSSEPQPIAGDTKEAELIGWNKEMMALSKEYIKKQTKFRITFAVFNAEKTLASSAMDFEVDKAPEIGVCKLMDHDNKRALLDLYTVVCQDWVDPDDKGIKSYKAYSIDENNQINILLTTFDETFDLVLKPGKLKLFVAISDTTRAYSTVPIGIVEVKAPTREEFEAYVAPSLLYFRLTGNQLQLMQAIQVIEVLLTYYGINRPDMVTESIAHAKLTEANIDFLKDLGNMTFNSMDDLEVIANTAACIVGDGYNVDKTGRKIAANLMKDLDKIFNDATHEAATFRTPYHAENYLTNVFSVLGGVAMAPHNVYSHWSSQFTGVVIRKVDPNIRIALECTDIAIDCLGNGLKFKLPDDSTSNQLANNIVLEGDLKHISEIEIDTKVPVGKSDLMIPKDLSQLKEELILNDAGKQAVQEVQLFDEMISTHQKQVLSNLVANEEAIKIKTLSGLIMHLQRGTNKHLNNKKDKLGEAVITFPDFCSLRADLMENCGDENDVAYAATLWSCLYPAVGLNLKQLNNASDTLEIDVFTGKLNLVNKIEVVNSLEPIEITVPRRNKEIRLPRPNAVQPQIAWFAKMMYHELDIETNGTSLTLMFTPETMNPSFLIFLRHKFKPYLHEYDCLFQTTELEPDDGNTTYIQISKKEIGYRTGKFYIGVVQLFKTETLTFGTNKTVDESLVNSNFTTTYTLSVLASGCHYYNPDDKAWKADGCVILEVTKQLTKCSCSHLTKFTTSFSVPPNPINFVYVFANAGFINNTTIYATIIFTLAVFILFLIWARHKDRRDIEKLGALPLPDNKQSDKYIYEILVFTGTCKQAGTDSRVSFVLTGDMNETEIRTFGSDFPRKTFARSGVDVFVMTESRPLGQLLLLRIWHDNSGEGYNTSWYLNYIVFRDVQTGEKFEFIVEDWFAVERGDRQIERVISVADKHTLSDFNHLFSTTGHKTLSNGHLWISVFCRRARSRFTRCQRVATCAAFMYLSMVTNAMWYRTTPDKPNNGFKIGPFALGLEELAIGFFSNIITYPPLFVIIFLFQKSRPRNLRKSRIDLALDQQRDVYGQSSTSGNVLPKKYAVKKYHRNKSCTLPWWFRLIAWFLCIGIIGTTIFFLWAYGIQFGDTKTRRWLTSLVVSFVSSVFITQPIKVFLAALVLSSVCKKVETDEDDADDDEEDPHLNSDESWLQNPDAQPRSTKLRHTRELDDYERTKHTRQKEVKSWLILKEVFVYLVFMWLAITISYGIQDSNAFLMVSTLKSGFVDRKGKNVSSFSELSDTGDYWSWMTDVFLSQLRVGRNYANQPPYGQTGFLADQVNRIMGNSILRQVRIKKDRCEGPIALRNFTECSGSTTSFVDEDEDDYDVGWREHQNTSEGAIDEKNMTFYRAFNYSTAENLTGIVLFGNLDAYSGGGYVYHLIEATAKVKTDLKLLQDNSWIDHRTRAVLIEFSVYNAQVNLFGVITLLAEFVPGGGIQTDYFIDGIQLLSDESNMGYFLMACQLAYLLFILSFTMTELRKFCRDPSGYFTAYANINELLLILCSYAALGIGVYRYLVVEEALDIFQETKGSRYINLQKCKFLTDLFTASIAFAVFFGFLKLINILRFNRNILTLSRTLIQVAEDLWGFAMILLIVFFAFGILFYLVFCTTLPRYATFFGALKSLVCVALNRFEFDDFIVAQPLLGPIMFFAFAFIMSIILINLLITIIIQSFDNVKKRMRRYRNEAEVLEFLTGLGKNLLNRDSTATRVPSIDVVREGPADDHSFSEKVDTLMEYVNRVYFDDRLDMSRPNWRYRHKQFNFDSPEVKHQVYNSN